MRLSDAVHGNGPISVNLSAANHNGSQEGMINRNVSDRNNDILQRNDSMDNNNYNNNINNNNNNNINNNNNNNNNNSSGKSIRSVLGGSNSDTMELISAPTSPKPRYYNGRDAEHLSNDISNYHTRNANFNIINNISKNEKGNINYHNNVNNDKNNNSNKNNNNNDDDNNNNNNDNHNDNNRNNNNDNNNNNRNNNNDNNSNNNNNIQYSNHPSRIPLAAYNRNTGIHDTLQIQGPYIHPHRTSHIGGINRTVTSQHSSNLFK